jgi:tetratricopeptide (TPR) repeat protein
VGRVREALGQITKARSYRQDDFEINQKFADISAELQVQDLSREVIEIRAVSFKQVFPSLDTYYKSNSIGTITLYNSRSTTVNDVQVSVYVHEVGQRPQIINVPSIVPRQDKLVDIPMEFNERLFDRARTVPVEITLSFEFEGTSYQPSIPSQSLEILGSKAMNWERRRSIASFVSPQDNNLSFFVRQNIVQAFSGEQSNIINRNLIRALQVYSFYRANGITYSSDSSISNLDASQLDEAQFPHQILSTKAGDCEDLLVLLAGTLESIGTHTALIDVPGHVMLGIMTEMNEAEIRKNGLEPEYFIEHKGTFWLPLETTLMGKADFVSSWLMAIKRYNEEIESGLMPEIIEFSEAHRLYPPSSYSKPIDSSSYQKLDDARSFYHSDLAKISNMSQINRELTYIAALEKYPANNSVRLQYALFSVEHGNLEQAERLLIEALNREPENFAAIINLGNLYAKSSRPQLAREQYQAALPHAAGKEDQVYRNLCLLEYRNMNRAKAVEYFSKMTRKEIIREVDMQIYADLVKTGD